MSLLPSSPVLPVLELPWSRPSRVTDTWGTFPCCSQQLCAAAGFSSSRQFLPRTRLGPTCSPGLCSLPPPLPAFPRKTQPRKHCPDCQLLIVSDKSALCLWHLSWDHPPTRHVSQQNALGAWFQSFYLELHGARLMESLTESLNLLSSCTLSWAQNKAESSNSLIMWVVFLERSASVPLKLGAHPAWLASTQGRSKGARE